MLVWTKFRIFYFTPLVGQLASCHDIFWPGFTITAHHVGSTWRPVPKDCLGSYTRSPSGLDTMSPMAHLMEGPTTRMDHLWVTRSMSQPSPHVSALYGTLSPMGLCYPTSQVTPNGMGHTLRVESTHELGHPTEWVAPWVRSVPIESLDSPRSDHVTSYGELHGIEYTTWPSMLPLWPPAPCNPTVPIPSMRPLVSSTL